MHCIYLMMSLQLLGHITRSFGQRVFDWATANTSVWLCAATYCSTNTYLSRTYTGYSQGFIPLATIDDSATDTQVLLQIFNTKIYLKSTMI